MELERGSASFHCMQVPMASSNNSVSENKKIKNGETSKTASKTKKNIDKQKKEENKKKKNKKLKLSNGNSREQRQGGEKEAKRKRQKHVEEEVEDAEGGGEAKTHVFPMNRIRTMLKGEDPDLRVSQEALLAINKAAVPFNLLYLHRSSISVTASSSSSSLLLSFSICIFPRRRSSLKVSRRKLMLVLFRTGRNL